MLLLLLCRVPRKSPHGSLPAFLAIITDDVPCSTKKHAGTCPHKSRESSHETKRTTIVGLKATFYLEIGKPKRKGSHGRISQLFPRAWNLMPTTRTHAGWQGVRSLRVNKKLYITFAYSRGKKTGPKVAGTAVLQTWEVPEHNVTINSTKRRKIR